MLGDYWFGPMTPTDRAVEWQRCQEAAFCRAWERVIGGIPPDIAIAAENGRINCLDHAREARRILGRGEVYSFCALDRRTMSIQGHAVLLVDGLVIDNGALSGHRVFSERDLAHYERECTDPAWGRPMRFNDPIPFNAPVTFNGEVNTVAFAPTVEVLVVNQIPLNRLKPLRIDPTTIPAGVAGSPYDYSLQVRGGTRPYAISIHSEDLSVPPSGTSFSNGRIYGTPYSGGIFSFRVVVTDGAGGALTQRITWPVASSISTVDTDNAPGGVFAHSAVVGVGYYSQVNWIGGAGAFTWTVISGSLPPGLNLATISDNGVGLSGEPTIPGSYPFTVRGTDSLGTTFDSPQLVVVDGSEISG